VWNRCRIAEQYGEQPTRVPTHTETRGGHVQGCGWLQGRVGKGRRTLPSG
jgi:hypothetical protein